MYTILIKKNKKDIHPFGVNNVIKNYIATYGKNDLLIACPGYQSTTMPRILDFCSELRRIAPNNRIFFSNGMNGSFIERSTGATIHDCHIPTIDPFTFGGVDHSKCILFVDNSNNSTMFIKAVLIGSSNLSYNTYVKSPTPKGEFDVLLIDERVVGSVDKLNAFRELLIDNDSKNRNRYLFSKTIDKENNDQDILKEYVSDLNLESIYEDK